MAEKYLVETHISANPQSWFGVENIFRKKNNCSCLYISFFENELHLWILKTTGVLYYKRISLEENLVQAGLPKICLRVNFWLIISGALVFYPLKIVKIGF